jgi:hypothetical protein
MKFNVGHPTFVTFLDNVNSAILSNVKINNYFKITTEKKFGIQYMVLKLMKNAVKTRAKLNNTELKSFIILLQTKNDESENYELSGVLKDIIVNFDSVNDFVKPVRKNKVIKVDEKQNEE